MKAAIIALGAFVLIIGIVITFFGGQHQLSVGRARGSAGPVLIVIGAGLILTGILIPI